MLITNTVFHSTSVIFLWPNLFLARLPRKKLPSSSPPAATLGVKIPNQSLISCHSCGHIKRHKLDYYFFPHNHHPLTTCFQAAHSCLTLRKMKQNRVDPSQNRNSNEGVSDTLSPRFTFALITRFRNSRPIWWVMSPRTKEWGVEDERNAARRPTPK